MFGCQIHRNRQLLKFRKPIAANYKLQEERSLANDIQGWSLNEFKRVDGRAEMGAAIKAIRFDSVERWVEDAVIERRRRWKSARYKSSRRWNRALPPIPSEENPIPRISRDELQPLAEIISRFWRYPASPRFEHVISRFELVFKNVTKLYRIIRFTFFNIVIFIDNK